MQKTDESFWLNIDPGGSVLHLESCPFVQEYTGAEKTAGTWLYFATQEAAGEAYPTLGTCTKCFLPKN
jgi:hypothetical protein